MNIAKHIITKFGKGSFAAGVSAFVEILKVDKSQVYRMTYPKNKGGRGGLIGAEHQQTLMKAAPKYGVDLSPSDFFEANSPP